MIFDLNEQIKNNHDLFIEANESWEQAQNNSELCDNLVDDKELISKAVNKIFNDIVCAEGVSGENGDFIMITYWDNWDKQAGRNVILKQYYINDLADFDSIKNLLIDIEKEMILDDLIEIENKK